ncbi:MAG TPA: N-acetylmuramoyl-L-alanine amidase [Actinomycetota bacterium]|nr:N-acetylmuramoyl-L-alanine amidase [Actinomycetota bacterium]
MIDFARVLRAAGVPVREVAGWRQRGRPPSSNPRDPAWPAATKFAGIGLHHTAGHNDLSVVVNGRPGLPGPLANLYVARDGMVYVVAAGRANHLGQGASEVYRRTLRDLAPLGDAAALGLADSMVGNGVYAGIEVENYGTPGDPYPGVQIASLEQACAALCRTAGWTANRCVQHREWTRRKVDMSYRGPLRAVVAAMLSEEDLILDAQTRAYFDAQFELLRLGDNPDPPTGDTHPQSFEGVLRRLDRIEALLEIVWRGDQPDPATGDTHPQNLETIWRQGQATTTALQAQAIDVTAIRTDVEAIRRAVEAMRPSGGAAGR